MSIINASPLARRVNRKIRYHSRFQDQLHEVAEKGQAEREMQKRTTGATKRKQHRLVYLTQLNLEKERALAQS